MESLFTNEPTGVFKLPDLGHETRIERLEKEVADLKRRLEK
jgi:hypothetical protein